MVSSTGCGPGPGRRGDPAVHRVAVRRRRGPLPHPVHPAGLAQRPAELGEQPAPSGGERDQLARRTGRAPRRRRRRLPRPRTPRTVNGPVDQRLRRAAVQRHAQQLHRALAAAPRPARRRRPRPSPGVSSPRWCCSGSSSGASGPPSASTRHGTGCRATKSSPSGPRSGTAVTYSVPSRRVGRQRAVAAGVGDPPQPGAVGRDRVHVADEVAVGPRVPRGDEGELARRRGARRRRRSRPSPVGHLDRLRQRRGVVGEVRGQVERRRPGCGRSARKPTSSRRYFSVVISRGGSAPGPTPVDGAVPALLGHPRGVGQPAGVRRPDRRPRPEVVVGQPARRTPGGGQQPDLRAARPARR